MHCQHCGKGTDADSRFCKQCGMRLLPNGSSAQAANNAPQAPSIFDEVLQKQEVPRSDKGFLLIAVLVLLHFAIWFIWRVLSLKMITKGNVGGYKWMNILSEAWRWLPVAAALVFVKEKSYKTIIFIILLIIIFFSVDQLRTLFRSLSFIST